MSTRTLNGTRQRLHHELRFAHCADARQVARENPDSVATHLGLATVGIEHPHAGYGARDEAGGPTPQQNAVRADSYMAVAQQTYGFARQRPGKRRGLDDEVIIAQSMPLGQSHGC
jgi:hypothetical protein